MKQVRTGKLKWVDQRTKSGPSLQSGQPRKLRVPWASYIESTDGKSLMPRTSLTRDGSRRANTKGRVLRAVAFGLFTVWAIVTMASFTVGGFIHVLLGFTAATALAGRWFSAADR